MRFLNEKPLFRPTWATVDLDAIRRNYDAILRTLGKDMGVMAMVKADAYGHGAVAVSRVLESEGVRALGVATVEEGIELRDAGINSQILVMGGLMGMGSPASRKMVERSLTPVIHSESVIDSLEQEALAQGKKIKVHIKVDTGMSRLGIRPEFLPRLVSKLADCENISVEGAMTHLADAGEADWAGEQYGSFIESVRLIEASLGPLEVLHIANSEAAMSGNNVRFEGNAECWVRPGLALYGECEGVDPLEGKLEPVMGLVSKVVLIKRVPENTRVSYCGIFRTKRPTKLAIIPIGYADGYPWSATGSAKVLIRGWRFPIVGRVTMDMIIVDITDAEDISVGDEVVLLGKQRDGFISVRELAGWATTIPYEIMCNISKRMPRVYVESKGDA
jgi:alanine racemase